MPDASIAFDHVHLVSEDPASAANWYVEKFGGKILKSGPVKGAPQVYVGLGGTMVIIRGQRPGEQAKDKPGIEWGIDHFGLQVKGDFDAFCADLKKKGVPFILEPEDMGPSTRIAFIKAPDRTVIELILRRDQ
jgi:catechol 2,3-dioxygenase-like lactoylglutathione lyase family enzyme